MILPFREAGQVFGVHFLVQRYSNLEKDVDGKVRSDRRVVPEMCIELEKVKQRLCRCQSFQRG